MRILLTLLLATVGLEASGSGLGGYAGAFTRAGYDARDVALAGALGADINSGYLALTNPASTVYVDGRELGMSYLSLPLDRNLQSVSLAFRLPPTAAASLSYIRAGDDNIQGRSSIGARTELLAYSEQVAILTFANRLGSALSIGINFKLLWITLDTESAKGLGVDFGIFYHTPGGINFAINLRNIMGAYSWKVPTSQGESIYDEHMPLVASIAARVPWRHFTFFGQSDVMKPRSAAIGLATRFAVEDKFGERYFIRVGAVNTTPTFGAGMRFTILHPLDSAIDYSLSLGKNGEGLGHIFTWRFGL